MFLFDEFILHVILSGIIMHSISSKNYLSSSAKRISLDSLLSPKNVSFSIRLVFISSKDDKKPLVTPKMNWE
jgi:hypothetical protein